MRRISKATREEAIEQCLLRADYWRCGSELPASSGVYGSRLADLAVHAVGESNCESELGEWVPNVYLEAAALLRGDDEHEPWSPGDATYLLPAARREES